MLGPGIRDSVVSADHVAYKEWPQTPGKVRQFRVAKIINYITIPITYVVAEEAVLCEPVSDGFPCYVAKYREITQKSRECGDQAQESMSDASRLQANSLKPGTGNYSVVTGNFITGSGNNRAGPIRQLMSASPPTTDIVASHRHFRF